MKKAKYTRQDVIDFFNKYHRAPTKKENITLYQHMCRLCKSGDEEIIAYREKYRSNTEKYARERMRGKSISNLRPWTEEDRKSALATRETNLRKINDNRRLKIYEQHKETGEWPKPNSTDYYWAWENKDKSEGGAKLWEDMHKSGKEQKTQKPVEKTPTGIEAKKISDLTLSEVSELLKLIGDRTVEELLAKKEEKVEDNSIDLSQIESSLSVEVLRIIVNPEEKATITNPKWETAKLVIEGMYNNEVLKNHFAAKYILKNELFVREVASQIMNNPTKRYGERVDKICEKLYKNLSPDSRLYDNPANIKDLVSKCLS